MAHFYIEFFSETLKRPVSFKMIIPNDRKNDPARKNSDKPMKTLFLLHGYTGAAENWVPEFLTTEYNFAIVMPNGENGFYLDGISTGHKYASFLGLELVDYVRDTFHLAMNAEETYIMGLSMGGFGAIHTALMFPERFGKLCALSSALIVYNVASMKPGFDNGVANYEYYRECFGDPVKVLESRNNPEVLVKELLAKGQALPKIFMACGTEDFLLQENRRFHQFLNDNQVEHTYYESKGVHDMVFWDEYARKFIPVLFA